MNAVTWILKLLLAGTLGWAGITKIAAPSEFATEIPNYQFFPSAAPIAASTLPGLEIVLAIALIVFRPRSPWLAGTALATIGVMALFTIAIAQVLARDINIDCGCFGGGSSPINWITLARDIGLLAASVVLLLFNNTHSAPQSGRLTLPR